MRKPQFTEINRLVQVAKLGFFSFWRQGKVINYKAWDMPREEAECALSPPSTICWATKVSYRFK
jgi:hypothetical protein